MYFIIKHKKLVTAVNCKASVNYRPACEILYAFFLPSVNWGILAMGLQRMLQIARFFPPNTYKVLLRFEKKSLIAASDIFH